ncbi:alpha/beta fold hydrolase [Streptomyces olivoverticillatus]
MSETPANTLQYRSDGPEDAPVLVLGPALGTTWHMWDRQIPELTRHWRVVRFDLPGHGGAPAQPAVGVAELTDRLLATLDRLGVDRFGYAGCSVSGAIGIDIALRHPQRLASLALVGSAAHHEGRGPGAAEIRTGGLEPVARSAPERWFTPVFAGAQPAIVDWAVQMVRTTDLHCYAAACEALAAFDVREELERAAVPTLVVVGADDEVAPPADARVLVAGIPDARLAVVPAARHLTPVEQPVAVTDLLVRHFTSAWQRTPQPVAAAPIPPIAPAGVFGPAPEPIPPAAEPTTPATGTPAAGTPAPAPAAPSPFIPAQTPTPAAPATPAAGTPAPAAPNPFTPAAPAPDAYEQGARIRQEVLGDAETGTDAGPADAARKDGFTAGFDDFVTRIAWGETWSRPGLDRRTRALVTLTALTVGGHLDDLATHTRGALRNGVTPEEIGEVLMHSALYCGLPAAGAAFAVARRVVEEERGTQG